MFIKLQLRRKSFQRYSASLQMTPMEGGKGNLILDFSA
jgi:hypothetical protein